MKKITYFLMAFWICVGIKMQAINLRDNLLFSAKLDGAQVVPTVATAGRGVGSFMLNKKRDSIAVNIGVIGFVPTKVGIYQGKPSENGQLVLDLSNFIAGNKLSTFLKGSDVTTNLAKFLRNDLYLVVSSANYPMGELRGAIKLEADLNFVADLSGAQAVPAVTTAAFGLGSFGLSMDETQVDFKIICQKLSGAILGVKLVNGSGAEVADLTNFKNGNVILGSISPNSSLLSGILSHDIFLNITTLANPTGEIRSLLRLQKGLAFDAFSTGGQMVPSITTNAKAVSVYRLSPTFDSLFYDVVVDGLNSSIDFSHLHIGFAGDVYDALQVDFTASIVGNRIKGFKKGAQVSNLTISKLLIANLSLIVHTGDHPGGEIRGQVTRFAREGFTINMTSAQSVPSTASNGFGVGVVSLDRDLENAHFMWVAGNLSAKPTGAHFHQQLIGQNGGVIFDLTDKMTSTDTEAACFGYWKSDDSPEFSPVEATKFDQNRVYLNIHNDNFPNGEIRGQVLKGQVFYPVTTGIEDDFLEKKFDYSVSPNPTSGEILLEITDLLAENLVVKMTDLVGKTVYFQSFLLISDYLSQKIDLSDFNPGFYFLSISDGKRVVSSKILKN